MFDLLFPRNWSTLKKLIWLKAAALSSAVQKTVTGAIVHIRDALAGPALNVTIAIEPVQDLNGYDSPWPAGGGKNILSGFSSDDYTGNTVSADGLTITTGTRTNNNIARGVLSDSIEVTTETTYYISFDAKLISGSCDNFSSISLFPSDNTTQLLNWRTVVNNPNLSSTKQRYKFYATGKANGTALKLYFQGVNTSNAVIEISNVCISLVENYEWYPYSNICPITGWTGANVTHTGANFWGGEKMANDMVAAVNNSTYCTKSSDTNGNYVTMRGNSAVEVPLFTGPFKANTRYTFIFKVRKSNTNAGLNLCARYTDGTEDNVSLPSAPESGTVYTAVFTTSSTKSLKEIRGKYISGIAYFYYQSCGWFTGVLTKDDFAAYSANTIPITFPDAAGTVYGGTLDVTNGVLTVYPYYSSYNGEALVGPWISSMDKYAAGKTPTTGAQVVDFGGVGTTYQLTPQQIDLLLGENTLWADTGDISLTYMADGRAEDVEALNILLAGRYHNSGAADEATDAEALNILLGGNR